LVKKVVKVVYWDVVEVVLKFGLKQLGVMDRLRRVPRVAGGFPVFGRSVREPTKIMAAHSFVEEAAPSCFAAAWVCLLGSKLSSTQGHSRTQRTHY
jgi:hypothetical protein